MPPGEPPAAPVGHAAEVYLHRRHGLLAGLVRIEQALRACDAWETNALLPADLQRELPPPLPREELDDLQRLLAEELARLDGATGT